MDKNICCKKILWDSQTEKAAVLKLDVYIKKHEQKFGKILFQKMLSRKQLKLLRLMHKLMRAIEKAEIDKQQAFQLLKASNDAIKTTISTFQDSMKRYKESVKTEFAKLDCLSTNRLLSINCTYT
ncbi:uncharacterized protein LOC117157642 [Bombus vancouverensis nearcticus]|uniref:Uncharacterized protein LOC117206562 n=2 Tax=Pyrobombus TaxID=144703 RepID=A0A6P8MJB9_9HYME|nr:uncharacterized protein LOC112212898 [Bombus impatiens]XP_033191731.1 uncharacterized protein LOC117157642 [Bombus vancouverensis nearcticus]XP_033301922.1 uncharacterized protein LOC117206562 [Bombus bifarius]XP_050480540.1 uncharacterized protein LOC126868773 [Bombus huntii]